MLPQSFAFRLNALFVLIVTAVMLTVGGLNYFKIKNERERAVQHQVKAILDRLAANLPDPIWVFDKNQIKRMLHSEMSDPDVVSLRITDGPKLLGSAARDGAGIVVDAPEKPAGFDFEKTAVLTYEEGGKQNTVGEVTIMVSMARVNFALRQDLLWLIASVLVCDVVVVLALSYSLSLLVLRPLARVREALRGIADGKADLTKRLPLSEISEFKELSVSFNAFIERLQRVVDDVRQGTDSLSVAAREIASGNQDLSDRTERQAAALEETAASMQELTTTVQQNTTNAHNADQLAQSAQTVATECGAVMGQVVGTMGSISDSSRKVGDIVSLIDGIAFQTNILALNAAVEAARAGEHGRGFAVVAAEVRSLSQRAASAAKEINVLVSDTVQTVEAGSKLVDEAGRTMREVVTSVEGVTQSMAQIVAASHEQMSGIEQVNLAIKDMDNVTQQNAALVEQAAAASGAMHDQAQSLGRAMAVFQV